MEIKIATLPLVKHALHVSLIVDFAVCYYLKILYIKLLYLSNNTHFTVPIACNPTCKNNGVCNNGICTCGENYGGPSCEISNLLILSTYIFYISHCSICFLILLFYFKIDYFMTATQPVQTENNGTDTTIGVGTEVSFSIKLRDITELNGDTIIDQFALDSQNISSIVNGIFLYKNISQKIKKIKMKQNKII